MKTMDGMLWNRLYSGEFGFTAVLSVNIGEENAGYTASLYYYKESAGKLEYICSDVVDKDGTVELTFTHASDYVIAIDKGEEESGEGISSGAPSETTESGSTENHSGLSQTGRVWRPWLFLVTGVFVLIMGIGVYFVAGRKRGDK